MDHRSPVTTEEASLACALVGPEFAARKESITRELFAHVDRVDELPDGYGFRFPSADPWATRALDFIAVERQCYPFFTFELVFEANEGPVWLRLRGSEQIKAFMLTELDEVMPASKSSTDAQPRGAYMMIPTPISAMVAPARS